MDSISTHQTHTHTATRTDLRVDKQGDRDVGREKRERDNAADAGGGRHLVGG